MFPLPQKTFRELYCERHRLPVERFDREVVWRSLNLQAKLFWWARWLNVDFFAADFDFVRGVGSLRRRRDFRNELFEFYYHPANRGILRRVLGFRVSGATLQKLFDAEIELGNSTPPMPMNDSSERREGTR